MSGEATNGASSGGENTVVRRGRLLVIHHGASYWR